MRGQIAPFDIGMLLIALVIFVIGVALLSWFVNVRSEISIKFMYEGNEAYRLLLSLLSFTFIIVFLSCFLFLFIFNMRIS
jgi:hypothetical protein